MESEFKIIGFSVDSQHNVRIKIKEKEAGNEGFILLDTDQISMIRSALEAEKILVKAISDEFIVEALRKEHKKDMDEIIKIMRERREKKREH